MKKLILIFLLLTSLAAVAQKQQFTIRDSIVIPLKSGSELTAVVVRLKTESKPLPAIVMYSIYANPQSDAEFNGIAALKGYVGVTVYIRGKYLGKQQVAPFVHDAEDAWEMIDWVSKQSWCNGKVGMYGASYLGFSQWAAVKKLHPALKTIVPQSAVGAGIDFPLHNNILPVYALQWLHYVTNNKYTDLKSFTDSKYWTALSNKWFRSGRSFASLDSLEGKPHAIFQQWLSHPDYDKYWQQMTPSDKAYSKLNIPVLTIAGYFDADQPGAMYYLKKHYANNPQANHYLVLGPYDHAGLQLIIPPVVYGYKIDSVAIIKRYALTFGWFDYVLKGAAKPALLQDKINYQVMGANKWEHVKNLDEVSSHSLKFYLGNKQEKGVYQLDTAVAGSGKINQQVSYLDRTDTLSADAKPLLLDTALKPGKNMLVFETASFEKTTVISGSFAGDLQVIINKKDIDLDIELYEKLPNGSYLQLNADFLRASYAKDRSKRHLLTPGQAAHIPLADKTSFISRQLAVGSKLVFVIGINKSPSFEVNYGTGKRVSLETIADGKEDLKISWLPGSYITIPVNK